MKKNSLFYCQNCNSSKEAINTNFWSRADLIKEKNMANYFDESDVIIDSHDLAEFLPLCKISFC